VTSPEADWGALSLCAVVPFRRLSVLGRAACGLLGACAQPRLPCSFFAIVGTRKPAIGPRPLCRPQGRARARVWSEQAKRARRTRVRGRGVGRTRKLTPTAANHAPVPAASARARQAHGFATHQPRPSRELFLTVGGQSRRGGRAVWTDDDGRGPGGGVQALRTRRLARALTTWARRTSPARAGVALRSRANGRGHRRRSPRMTAVADAPGLAAVTGRCKLHTVGGRVRARFLATARAHRRIDRVGPALAVPATHPCRGLLFAPLLVIEGGERRDRWTPCMYPRRTTSDPVCIGAACTHLGFRWHWLRARLPPWCRTAMHTPPLRGQGTTAGSHGGAVSVSARQ